MEQLTIHTIQMSKRGEFQVFELPLLNNAKRITGLWYKIRLIDFLPIKPIKRAAAVRPRPSIFRSPVVVGQLSLSSNTSEDVGFFGNLLLDSPNNGLLDYTASVFPVSEPTHTKPKGHLQVNIEANSSSIQGFIADRWGVISGRNMRYEVDLYLYQETETSKSKCK